MMGARTLAPVKQGVTVSDAILAQVLEKVTQTQIAVARIEGEQKTGHATLQGELNVLNNQIQNLTSTQNAHSKDDDDRHVAFDKRLGKAEGDIGELKGKSQFSAGKQSMLAGVVAALTSLGVGVAVAYAKLFMGDG